MRLNEARRYDEAAVALRRALDMEADNFLARAFPAQNYISWGEPLEAIRELDRPLFRDSPIMAMAYAAAGQRRQALDILHNVRPPAGTGDYLTMAVAFAWLQDRTRAFEWLTKAFDERTYVAYAKVSPLFDQFQRRSTFRSARRSVTSTRVKPSPDTDGDHPVIFFIVTLSSRFGYSPLT